MSKPRYEEVTSNMESIENGEESFFVSKEASLFGSRSQRVSNYPSSASMFKDGEEFLTKSVRKCNGVLLQGPRKLLKLCLFGLLLPVMLISIPLYVRLIIYPPFQFVMAPTDQRSLEKTSSSVWCQGQTVQMNGSFNAYLLPETPRKKMNYSTHTMLQHVKLKDDVKEYWGFFFQKGSIVNINLCTRHDGGMLMIMRGVNNLKKCAWIGQEDSAEQDEDHKETSNESGQRTGVYHDFPMAPGEILMEIERDRSIFSKLNNTRITEKNLTSEERREELEFYIKKVIKLSKNKKEILKGLKKHKLNLKDKVQSKNFKEMNSKHGIKQMVEMEADEKNKKSNIFASKNKKKSERLDRVRRSLVEEEEKSEGGEVGLEEEQKAFRKNIYLNADNSSYEVSNATKELYLSLLQLPDDLKYERGSVNQSFDHDMSHEEHRSSFSSSEEALTKCEGLIGLLPLYPSRRCSKFSDTHTNKIRYKIPLTGTYFFVFSSDNEVFDVDMYFNLTMERVVFDTDSSKYSCMNRTNCSLAFSFWSHDQAIVEVPEGNWDNDYTVEIKCEPRVAIYLIFLFLTPIFILFCAFH